MDVVWGMGLSVPFALLPPVFARCVGGWLACRDGCVCGGEGTQTGGLDKFSRWWRLVEKEEGSEEGSLVRCLICFGQVCACVFRPLVQAGRGGGLLVCRQLAGWREVCAQQAAPETRACDQKARGGGGRGGGKREGTGYTL